MKRIEPTAEMQAFASKLGAFVANKGKYLDDGVILGVLAQFSGYFAAYCADRGMTAEEFRQVMNLNHRDGLREYARMSQAEESGVQ